MRHKAYVDGLPAAHPVFAGHFPGRPVVPGVVLLDHVIAHIARASGSGGGLTVVEARFLRPLGPDSAFELYWEQEGSQVRFRCQHDNQEIARGKLAFT